MPMQAAVSDKIEEALTEEQRLEENKHVVGLIETSSVVPERAHIRYYLVSMEWFKRW